VIFSAHKYIIVWVMNTFEAASSDLLAATEWPRIKTKNQLIMKKLLTLLAVTASLAVFVPTTSQARDSHGHSSRSFSHSCNSCGTSVYRERAVTGYDRHGHAVYGYRTVGHSCRSNSGHGRGHSSGQSSHHNSGRSGHISGPGFHLDLGGHSSRH
jgi:hypothetical protein